MDYDSFLFKLKTVLTYMNLGERMKPIDGYLLDMHAYTLMTLANEGPGSGAIVEIGSFMGKSTCCLGLGTKSAQREKVYAIDHFTGSPEHQSGGECEIPAIVETGTTVHKFQENIRSFDLEDYVVPIKASSEEAAANWSGPIRLLFIGADHTYEASRLDFALWSPHVVLGGLIASHDIGYWEGVIQFYKDLMAITTEFKEIVGIGGLSIIERTALPAADQG